MKRKIAVITGTRADYGILSPVIKQINASKKLEAQLYITGMHLMVEFGHTIDEIKRDGMNIAQEIDISYKEDTGPAMAISVGKAVSRFAESFARLQPDFVLVLGDRGEMLAATIAGSYLNIPVAHIHGGEISGHIDGMLRHAITKLAHLHFPATISAKQRIIKLGEEPWRVVLAGAPALDRILKEELPTKTELVKKYEITNDKPLVILLQHPLITEINRAGAQIKTTLDAVKDTGAQTVVIYPNADAGGRAMISVIEEYRNIACFNIIKNIPHKDYLGLMKIADVLIGNSSSGIIEAPSFKLPVVNIGSRQEGREHADNIIDVPYDRIAIIKAINRSLNNKKFIARIKSLKNPYGDGRAAEIIVKTLSNVKLDNRLLNKRMTY